MPSNNLVPRQLAAPEPTWTVTTDVVILGSGAAGLSAALAARPVRDVVLITKMFLQLEVQVGHKAV